MKDPFKDTPDCLIMCILDGWGIAPDSPRNAITQAQLPCWNTLLAKFPHCELIASGNAVGLPEGQIGNSEVGHMTIGSGRTILQDLERINEIVKNNLLKSDPELILLADRIKNHGGKCHIVGICSDGGVHGHIDHLLKIALILVSKSVNVIIHLILDGRDVLPTSAIEYLERVKAEVAKIPNMLKIGSICGRYYAMDRDNRWERTAIAYKAMVMAEGNKTSNFIEAVKKSYANGKTDEFVEPIINSSYQGMNNGDSILLTNFRADRINQLATALVEGNEFNYFNRPKKINFLNKVSMTSYSNKLNNFYRIIFKPRNFTNTLGEVLSNFSKKQLRISESEKYPHVTYFFNAGKESPFLNEERHLIPSAKVAKYDEKPEMSAQQITKAVIEAISSKKYNFILCNYANPDMVAHTGNFAATVKAIEAIDNSLAQITNLVLKQEATLIVTSDHGNCEEMIDSKTGSPKTAHTCNPVPFLIVNKQYNRENVKLQNGSLRDIAPTILDIFRMKIPFDMTGRTLIVK